MKAHQQTTIVGLLAAAGTVASLVAQTNPREQIRVHYDRAQNALSQDQPDAAAKEFRAILRLDPKNAAAYANLGMIAFKQRRYAEAAEGFGAALKLNPSLWDAEAFLGLSHARLGRSQEAKTLLERSLRHIQNHALRTEIAMELIRIAQETNTLDSAVDALR